MVSRIKYTFVMSSEERAETSTVRDLAPLKLVFSTSQASVEMTSEPFLCLSAPPEKTGQVLCEIK